VDSIFTKIIKGEIPSYKLAENDDFLAFLDINPIAKGHALVISKKQIDYIFDLEDSLLASMNVFAKKVGLAIDKVVPCKRIGIAVIGLEVPHAHMHLVPLNNIYDIDFKKEKLRFTKEEFSQLAKEISSKIKKA
jgi:histidine triad (HIT) family protein